MLTIHTELCLDYEAGEIQLNRMSVMTSYDAHLMKGRCPSAESLAAFESPR